MSSDISSDTSSPLPGANVLSASDVRALPSRPDLEHERKRAVQITECCNGKIALSEAQLLVARSYGFACWEKLERYFTQWELHTRAPRQSFYHIQYADSSVRQLLLEFSNRHVMPIQPPDIIGTGAAISTYVPRFYGLTDAEIFASTLSEEEAQLIAARRLRFNSWQELKEAQAAYVPPPKPTDEQREKMKQYSGPITFATYTRGDTDRERITNLFTDDRRMFGTEGQSMGDWYTWRMLFVALNALPDKHEMLAWIKSLGVDVQTPLNMTLLGAPVPLRNDAILTPIVLEFGADPHYTPINGLSVLEHALVRHASGSSVDLIAARVTPRSAFWIAAGLGDVAAMNSFFESDGKLSRAAHEDRPDFIALGSAQLSGLGRPDASELHVMWEAFIVAVLNERVNTVEALLDHGLPPDYSPVWMNALHFCADYNFEHVARLLLARGADPDFRAWPDQSSPRDIAKSVLEHAPGNKTAQMISLHGIK